MLPKLPWRLQKSLGFCCFEGRKHTLFFGGRKNTNWQTTQGIFCCSSLLLLESLTCFFTCFCAYDETHWNPNVIWQCQHTRPSSQLRAFQVALTNLASEQKSTCTSWDSLGQGHLKWIGIIGIPIFISSLRVSLEHTEITSAGIWGSLLHVPKVESRQSW